MYLAKHGLAMDTAINSIFGCNGWKVQNGVSNMESSVRLRLTFRIEETFKKEKA